MKRILLVNPQVREGRNVLALYPPLGLAMIAEILETNNFEYDVIDMSLNYKYRHLKRKISAFRPDIIGVKLFSFYFKDNYALFRKIKRDFPDIKILVGGPHISIVKKHALLECPAIDFGAVGEGEEVIKEIMEDRPVSEIKGLIYREGSEVIENKPRELIQKLDDIPFPKYRKFEMDKYIHKRISILTSRGCPAQCIYCAIKSVIGRQFRVRSANYVVDEIEYWYKRGIRQFSIADDNFVQIKSRVYEICNEIERRGLKGLSLSCGNGIRADCVDYDMLKRMRNVGFDYIAFGVEAGNNKMLKILKKGETIETIEKAIRYALDLNYSVDLTFIIGSPGETWQDLQDSARIVRKYPVNSYFYNLIPFPSTELYEMLKKDGLLLSPPGVYLNNASNFINNPIFETKELTRKQRSRSFKMLQRVSKKSRQKMLMKRYGRFKGKIYSYTIPITTELMWRAYMLSPSVYRFANKSYRILIGNLLRIRLYDKYKQ